METRPVVRLIACTPEAETVVAAAAKLCYSRGTVDELLEGLTPEKVESFLEMLAEIGHESPIEHASFTFAIEGVSRSLLAQITRHRIASYSVQSQRYVKERDFDYIVPPEIAAVPQTKALFAEAMEAAGEAYDKIAALLQEKHRQEFLAQGKGEKEARRLAEKKAIEDARFVLPNACDTKMVVTMNARSLYNFFRHRLCHRAQWELREVALQMLQLCLEKAPVLFSKAGPPCFAGHCPEGKMSCGRAGEMRAFYQALRGGKA